MSKLIPITDDFSLPLDLITLRQAIYGASGSGKTTWARLLAEKVHEAGHRFCAIDLKNDWYGLKSTADGSAAGIPVVIFGGPRRDVQIFDDAGAAVADTVASIEQPVIVDLDAMSRYKQERFLTTFLDRLYDVNRGTLLLIADEADRYAPQKPMSEEAIKSLSSSEDICRRGRKRGIGSAWLTQRTAVLNKNVSDICDLTVVFRTPGSRDLNDLEERVGRLGSKEQVREVMRLAPGLEDGQAFFLSSHPKLRKFLPDPVRPIQLPRPWTFDSSATPGVGQRKKEPRVLAQADLAAIESKMNAQVEKAKTEDPKHLRAEVARLNSELAKAEKLQHHAKPAEVKVREVPVLKDGQIDKLSTVADRLQASLVKTGELYQQAIDLRDGVCVALRQLGKPSTQIPAGAAVRVAPPPRAAVLNSPATVPPEGRPAEGEVGQKGGLRRILIALAQRPAGLTNRQIGVRAGISAKGGTFGTYLSRARSSGWIRDEQDRRLITDAGLAALGSFEPLPSGSALLAHWLAELGEGGCSRILGAIAAAWPAAMSNQQIAEAAGVSSAGGTFGTYMSRLRSLELIQSAGKGISKASDELFD